MATQRFEEEFKFPHEKTAVEEEDRLEIEIEDDTPPEDRGRKPAAPVDEVTDDELASYDEKVQKRIKKFTRGYHDERRAKEEALAWREILVGERAVGFHFLASVKKFLQLLTVYRVFPAVVFAVLNIVHEPFVDLVSLAPVSDLKIDAT